MANRWRWTVVWLILAAFFCAALWDFYEAFILVGNPPAFISKRLIILLIGLPFLAFFWGYWLWAILSEHFPVNFFRKISVDINRIIPPLRILTAGVLLVLPALLLLFSPLGDYHPGYWFRLALLVGCAIFATLILFPTSPDLPWLVRSSALIMTAAVVLVIGDWLNDVNSYPFSLTWSEGNRIWDYSVLFGSSRYNNSDGEKIFTFIEEGRQVLWGLPFLLPNLTIFGFRLWNAMVWILPPALVAACCVVGKTASNRKWFWKSSFILWGFLFLSQGPIYSPLLLAAAVVVIAVRQKHLWLAILLLAFAAYYANVSRWTWMYAPGLWAGLLALLREDNPNFSRRGWRKLFKPVVLGLSGYFGAHYLSPLITNIGNNNLPPSVNTPLDMLPNFGIQAMLWNRLLPNPTYPPGILLGIAWVGLPAILLIYAFWKEKIWKPNKLQIISLILMVGLFLILGIFVSVKIGGGSNLHNLDMLLVTLALVLGFLWKKWMDSGSPGLFVRNNLSTFLIVAMIFPATVMTQYGEPLRLPDEQLTQTVLARIQSEVSVAKTRGPVLFIDQRQLLTFGFIEDLPLVDEYEKKYLMDRALAGNEIYLKGFETDLSKKKLALIITEPISGMQADEGLKNFAEENNAWVQWVSMPMIKYYRPILSDNKIGVQLLIPRE
ncbi:MAG: hypothetical protein AB9891_10350 [Anaerolineaceae bacterium]